MKHGDIQADGTVYWYDKRQDWGKYISPAYDRGPVVRVGTERYEGGSGRWSRSASDYYADPKGKYVKVQPMAVDGTTPDGNPRFVLTAHIRDTYSAVKERYNLAAEAEARREADRAAKADDAARRAKALRARLAALDLLDAVRVTSTDGKAWGTTPGVRVEWCRAAESALSDVLDRLEAKTDDAAWRAGYAEGELVADAARDAALGYTLRPEQAAALARAEEGLRTAPPSARPVERVAKYDPEFADRLANGAYEH
jgi:hypothetical protein